MPSSPNPIDVRGFTTDATALNDDDPTEVCYVCFGPAAPHVMLGCGHALCGSCGGQVQRCPQCRQAVTSRVQYHAGTQRVLGKLRYACETDGCPFTGGRDAAEGHRCNVRAIRLRVLVPLMSFGEVVEVLDGVPTPSADSEEYDAVDALLVANERAQAAKAAAAAAAAAARAMSDTSTSSSSSTASTDGVPGAAASAQLFWDYDNVRPEFVAASGSVVRFYGALVKHLRQEHGVRVRDSTAYLVAGRNYGAAPEKLAGLQVAMRLSSQKREAADRDLSADVRKLREQQAPGRAAVVIVSSDKDFVRDVKELADAGHAVYVVHAAKPGSDHEAILAHHATAAIHVSSFTAIRDASFAAIAAAAPAAPPAGAGIVPPRGPDAAQPRNGETLTVEGVAVPVSALVANGLLTHAAQHPGAQGKWCTNAGPTHDARGCSFAHCAAGHFRVGAHVYADRELLPNAAVEYLRANPGKRGRPCTAAHAHDYAACDYVHFKAGRDPRGGAAPAAAADAPAAFVRVDGARVAASTLVRNAGLRRLLADPTVEGATCRHHGNPNHDAASCHFVHPATATAPVPAVPAAPTAASAADATVVVVDGERVRADALVANEALQYLLANPGKKGRTCRRAGEPGHSASGCTFVHRK